MISAALLSDLLSEVEAVEGPYYTLQIIPDADGACALLTERGDARVTLRLIAWGEDGEGRRALRDIKEQESFFLNLSAHDSEAPERLEAHLQGWARAVQALFEVAPRGSLDGVMPSDLVFPAVWALKRPRSVEQFQSAFCVSSRLGRYAPRG